MTDDDPLDLARVAADDAAVEALRTRSVPSDDSALELLRDLLVDVELDLPANPPVTRGSTVLRLTGETTTDPRIARGGAVVALVTAGLVALGGVAAASTAVAPGNPLHGLGEAVRSAAGAVVTAVKPPAPEGSASADSTLPSPAAGRATPSPTARSIAPAGPEVAAAARSQAAARQVTALLDEAEQLLTGGRAAAAGQRLDTAERRLADVAPAAAEALRARLTDLRADVDAALAADEQPAAEPRSGVREEPTPRHRPEAPRRTEPPPKAAASQDAASQDAAGRGADDESGPSQRPTGKGTARTLAPRR